MKRLRPFLKFYGSKWRLAPKYPRPLHSTICEPFAGSAAYSTLHHKCDVHLFDSWDWVVSLWRGLIDATEKDVRGLPGHRDLTPGQNLWDLDLPEWGVHLIGAWQRVGINDCRTVSKWNGLPGMWSSDVRDTIARQVGQIRHWQVDEADGMTVLSKSQDRSDVTWFIDPPYESQPRVYRSQGPDLERLARLCQHQAGQVIACDLADATWLPFAPLAENTSGGARQGTSRAKKIEGIWTNDLTRPTNPVTMNL
mgnify:CR=1 FL=1